MSELFYFNAGATPTPNEKFNGIGDWNVSNVTNMASMFKGNACRAFNQPLNNWDVSRVTTMASMFENATAFNQPLNNWDVSNVTNMRGMFFNAATFNQPLNNWNVSNVINMAYMFAQALAFNQPLNDWAVTSNTNFSYIVDGATAFNPNFLFHLLERENVIDDDDDDDDDDDGLNGNVYENTPSAELVPNEFRIPADAQGFDVINGETNVYEFLSESPDNFVIVSNHNYTLLNKQTVDEHIIPNKSNIKFGCREISRSIVPMAENVIRDIPYLSVRSLGVMSGGLIRLNAIKSVLTNPTIRAIYIPSRPTMHLITTTSLQMLGRNPGAVSASHCQEGQGEAVYDIFKITPTATGGSNKHRLYRHKTPRRIKQYRHRKKHNTRCRQRTTSCRLKTRKCAQHRH
jgi:surface protein